MSAASCFALPVVGCTQDVAGTFDPGTSGTPTSTGSSTNPTTEDSGESSSSSSSTGDAGSSSSGSSSTSTGEASDSSSSGNFGSLCGNGTIEGTEECDCGDDGECSKADLNDLACADIRDPLVPGILTGGVLGCNTASCRFDTSQCVYCGDGQINGNETCELNEPVDNTCKGLGKGTAGKLSCMDTCQIDTVACTECGYTFTFEGDECPGEWSTLRTTGEANIETWECGNPGTYSQGPGADKTGMWATNLDGPYETVGSGYVRSGALDLSNCEEQDVTLTIRHWFNFVGGVTNRDGGVVQIATSEPDLEGSWTTIEPISGVVYQPGINASFPPVDGNPGFSGLDPMEREWVESGFDITPFVGGDIYIRFVLGSGTGSPQGGWYIDNVEILGSGGVGGKK